ncbi:helix-turn-helix domain-containing protein [Actinacidiphila bryophytorum]|uniref:DNA-binding protein n=1 Tax=Actinacidiphila bryophytorum TaxID=1436133 RepID=A0A9W4ECP7_9ACTN|nr:helix-turn-helix transcriptional regulator [Actinacidiphila bryophytorum]MBM9439710.1 helix-turn-helix domain-containing protein [Actinacidiphila bryophytorum]MBN6547598.1 helix-turn-helix domain-containing protein [Actinacidiphila bryophytorum]CAG7606011.1 putative DNA-binding protein [Actinacidiphila bryophytorum]
MTANGTGGGGTVSGGEPEPSDSLRTFGAFVQALREHAGMSREEFGTLMGLSKHTVTSIEVGRRMPDPDFVERAEPLLGNTGALRNAVRHLSRRPGLASWFRQWARKEETAISLCTYECRVIPGLLQTEAYARALFEERLPPLSDEEIQAQWTARAERQRLLRGRPNTAFSFVLDEHLFLRRTGGSEAARNLLDHVLEVSRRRNIEIQVLPTTTGVHPGLDGPIRLLETAENHWFGYSEGQETGQLISEAKVVSVLQQRYAKLRSQALTPEESGSLLLRLRGEL